MAKRVLVLCTGNSCRSQMAEGFARMILADAIEAHSAGIAPVGVNPRAARVMAEAGFSIDDRRSKSVDELRDVRFDCVITVCGDADERCPAPIRGVPRVHHGFADPPRLAAGCATEAEALVHYRLVRDEIRRWIECEVLDEIAKARSGENR